LLEDVAVALLGIGLLDQHLKVCIRRCPGPEKIDQRREGEVIEIAQHDHPHRGILCDKRVNGVAHHLRLRQPLRL
jgi:hypothetical protein